jgi:hypothetical protein
VEPKSNSTEIKGQYAIKISYIINILIKYVIVLQLSMYLILSLAVTECESYCVARQNLPGDCHFCISVSSYHHILMNKVGE